jgi:hypothetical protein
MQTFRRKLNAVIEQHSSFLASLEREQPRPKHNMGSMYQIEGGYFGPKWETGLQMD